MYYDQDIFEYLEELRDDIDVYQNEFEYMYSFLSSMDLWQQYLYFKANSHLEQDEDDPFPRYAL